MTLKDLREQNGKSRAEVAAALGVTLQTYANYENGWRRISLEQVLALTKLFNCTAEEVIEAQLNNSRNDR